MLDVRVAVVIPAYNPGRYLRPALDSVVRQDFSSWQAVVVDDGSTEDLSFAAELDPRIRVLRQRNIGPAGAQNAGIAASESEFVALLGADDLWLPGKLAEQVSYLDDHPEVGLCSTDFEIVDGDGERINSGWVGFRDDYLDLLGGCGICASTVMIRRSILDRVGLFDLAYRQAEDWDLWIRIAKMAKLGRVNTVLAQYRIHDSNITNNYRVVLRDGSAMLRSKEREGRREGDADAAAAARAGIRRLRALAGHKAFDAFRELQQTSALLDSLRYAPRYTVGSIARHQIRTLLGRTLGRARTPA